MVTHTWKSLGIFISSCKKKNIYIYILTVGENMPLFVFKLDLIML